MKVAELAGSKLDQAVALANGLTARFDEWHKQKFYHNENGEVVISVDDYVPSTNWQQGGEIIERESIALRHVPKYGYWIAKISKHNTGSIERWHKSTNARPTDPAYLQGSTALEAAMRCFVASKFGDTLTLKELRNKNK